LGQVPLLGRAGCRTPNTRGPDSLTESVLCPDVTGNFSSGVIPNLGGAVYISRRDFPVFSVTIESHHSSAGADETW